MAVQCPSGKYKNINRRGMKVCNCADDLGNTKFIYSHVMIAYRFIATCINMSSEISLVRRSLIPSGTQLLICSTQITGTGNDTTQISEVWVRKMETEAFRFKIKLVVVGRLSFSMLFGLDTNI